MIESANRLKDSLEAYKKLLDQPGMFKLVRKVFRKVKYAFLSTQNVELLDLSQLTKNPASLKDFVNDLKILAKFSPDLLRFVFRNTPVVFLGKDILDASKK
jgi:hypothetical protein